MSKISDAELHDYLDGELEEAEMRGLEARLDEEGQARLDELRQVRESLGALPKAAVTPKGLWDGIESRIADTPGAGTGSAGDAKVVPLHPKAVSQPVRMRVGTRLMAASVALLALAGAYWLGARNSGAVGPAQIAESEMPSPAVEFAGDPVGESVLTEDVIDTFVAASAELEAVLNEGADRLQPDTREILENSLATIDAAIAEAREALANDPGSPLVERRLVQALQFKLGVLRQGVSAVQRAT